MRTTTTMKKSLLLTICSLFLLNAFGQQLTNPMIFRVNSPAPVAADLNYGYTTDFGPTAMNTVTGDLAWGYTALGDSLGCDPIVTNLTGKIALIRRGACNFSLKIYHAQAAGAVGCVILDNTGPGTNDVINMSGGDSMTVITIPAVFLGYDDGAALPDQILLGTTTNVSFFVPSIFNASASFAYNTPQSQITDLTGMRATIYNSSASPASNVDIVLDIYDPVGGVTSLGETVNTLPNQYDTVVTFSSAYTPSLVGTYTAVFKSSLNPSDSIVKTFEINTDNLFALDNDDFSSAGGIGPSDANFAINGFVYDMGALYVVPNSVSSDSIMATFALSNAGAYLGEIFVIELYEEPAGGFSGTEPDYSTFNLLAAATATISVTDTVVQHSLITRKLLDINNGNEFQTMSGGKKYMLVIKYAGASTISESPKYSYTHQEKFLSYGATVFTDRLYMGGWTANYAPVIRLELESCGLSTLDLNVTEAAGVLTSDQGVPATYQWIDCAANMDIAGETGQSYTPTVTGDYAVIVSNGACSDTSACTTVTCCTPDPITSQPMDVTVPLNGSGMFSTTTSITSPTYQWQMDNGTGYMDLTNAGQFSGVDTDMLTVSNVTLGQNNTLFRCIVSENSNCSDTTDVAVLTVEDNTGLDDLNKDIFNVYPNPTTNSFTISSDNLINSEFKIIDAQGREVLTGSMNGQEHTIDISKLSNGVYSVVFNNTEYPVVSVIKE